MVRPEYQISLTTLWQMLAPQRACVALVCIELGMVTAAGSIPKTSWHVRCPPYSGLDRGGNVDDRCVQAVWERDK